jgi:exosortase N
MEGLNRYIAFTNKGTTATNRWYASILVAYAIVFAVGLNTYIHWQNINLVLGIACLCFCTTVNARHTGGTRFGYLSALLLLLLFLMPVKTLLYLSIITAVMFVVESKYGRMNILPLFTILFMSPFFQYVAEAFSFPIRLQLSEWAGRILSTCGMNITVEGNVLLLDGQSFSVDTACMGLNMLVASLLLCLMLIGIYQKKYAKQIKVVWCIALLSIVFVLNVFSNLLRIILLVQFSILPGNILHDVIGIICLLVYVFIPAILIISHFIKKFGKQNVPRQSLKQLWIAPHLSILLLLLMLLPATMKGRNKNASWNTSGFLSAGYSAQVVNDNVIKLDNGKSLVYIKPIENFYNADHNPMICWRGSGYSLVKIRRTELCGLQVYTATLQKGKDELYTTWWYDNQHDQTISQLRWRWQMLQGKNAYALVNVTSNSAEMLQLQMNEMMSHNLLTPRTAL